MSLRGALVASLLLACQCLPAVSSTRSVDVAVELVHADASQLGKPDTSKYRVTVNGAELGADRRLQISFDLALGEAEKLLQVAVFDSTNQKPVTDPIGVDLPAFPSRSKFVFYVPVGARQKLDDVSIRTMTRDYTRDMPSDLRMQQLASLRVAVDAIVRGESFGLIARNQIRATYSFLRLSRDLSQSRGIRHDNLALKAADWLRAQIRSSKQTVDSALHLGSADALTLTEHIRGTAAFRYGRLYDEITALKDSDANQKCALYVGVQGRMESLLDGMDENVGFNDVFARVSTASAECRRTALLANLESAAARDAVVNQIAVLNRIGLLRTSKRMNGLVLDHAKALKSFRIK